MPGSQRTISQVAEDAQFLAFTSSGDQLTWLDPAETDALLTAQPTGNVHDELAAAQLRRALHRLPALQEHLIGIGSSVAADAVEAHRAVRRTSRIGLRGIDARPLAPPDVLGVYIYLPDQGTSSARWRRSRPSAPSAPCYRPKRSPEPLTCGCQAKVRRTTNSLQEWPSTLRSPVRGTRPWAPTAPGRSPWTGSPTATQPPH